MLQQRLHWFVDCTEVSDLFIIITHARDSGWWSKSSGISGSSSSCSDDSEERQEEKTHTMKTMIQTKTSHAEIKNKQTNKVKWMGPNHNRGDLRAGLDTDYPEPTALVSPHDRALGHSVEEKLSFKRQKTSRSTRVRVGGWLRYLLLTERVNLLLKTLMRRFLALWFNTVMNKITANIQWI